MPVALPARTCRQVQTSLSTNRYPSLRFWNSMWQFPNLSNGEQHTKPYGINRKSSHSVCLSLRKAMSNSFQFWMLPITDYFIVEKRTLHISAWEIVLHLPQRTLLQGTLQYRGHWNSTFSSHFRFGSFVWPNITIKITVVLLAQNPLASLKARWTTPQWIFLMIFD